MESCFACILFFSIFLRNEASQNPINIHWVMSSRSIQPTGFLSELLGISTSLVNQFPNMKLAKSFFVSSLEEAPLANGLLNTLFCEEKRAIEALVNDTIIDMSHLIVPRSQYVQEKAVGLEECCEDSSLWLKNVTVYGKELSKAQVILPQPNPHFCCEACARHFGCITWSFVNNNCRLHHQQYSQSQITSPKLVSQINDDSPTTIKLPTVSSYVGSFSLSKRYPKPQVIVLHGTNCFYQNVSIEFHRNVDTIVIGRFMLERSMQVKKFTADERAIIACLHLMDELWVPTEWHRDVFHRLFREQTAKAPPPITVIGEAVDPNLFSPFSIKSEIQELESTVDGFSTNISKSQDTIESYILKLAEKECAWAMKNQHYKCANHGSYFDFLSIFKWESRKGWDILLTSFISAFTAEDHVRLKIHTSDVLQVSDAIPLWTRILEFVNATFPSRSVESLPRIEITETMAFHLSATEPPQNKSYGNISLQQRHQPLTRMELRNLYASVDAFVLPTRGEGWGLPIAEAMTMALPVIVTDAPGPRAFTQPVGASSPIAYILNVVPDAVDEMGFLQPDVHHLTHLLKRVIDDSSPAGDYEAQKRGQRARDYMKTHWRSEDLVRRMNERIRFHTNLRGWQY